MKREIKFRAWVIKSWNNYEWVKNKIIYNAYPIKSNVSFNENNYKLSFCNKNECELMQYTGLKDKNGVEIYEGDVIKSLNYLGNRDITPIIIGVVEYRLGGFGIEKGLYLGAYQQEDIEVIGNIYENPELLEK